MLETNSEYTIHANATTNIQLDSQKDYEVASDQVIQREINNTHTNIYENQLDFNSSQSSILSNQYSLLQTSENIDEEAILKNILEEKFRSKFKGVFKCGRRYKAQIQINKAQHYLGVYDTELEAALAYDDHARMVLGKKAKTNFDYDSLNNQSTSNSTTQATTNFIPNAVYDPISTHMNNPAAITTPAAATTAAAAVHSLLHYNSINQLNGSALTQQCYGNSVPLTMVKPYHISSSQHSMLWPDPHFPKATKRTYVGLKVKRNALKSQLKNIPIPSQGYSASVPTISTPNVSYADQYLTGTSMVNDLNANNSGLPRHNDLKQEQPPMYDNQTAQQLHDLELYQQYQLYQHYLQYQQQILQQQHLIQPNLMQGSYLPSNHDSYLQIPQDLNYFNIENNMKDLGQPNIPTTTTATATTTTTDTNYHTKANEVVHIQQQQHQDKNNNNNKEEEEEEDVDWREQLYYWTGKLFYVPTTKQLNWQGVWVGSYTGKPSIDEFRNSRNVFEYTSEFVVDPSQISADDGSLKPLSSYYLGYYLMDNNGSGLLEKYLDHEYYMEFDLISNTFLGSQYSVVGKGDSEFGCFVIIGVFNTETGILEMTRKYISETDARCTMSMAELKKTFLHN